MLLQIRFSALAGPRALWLVCYLLALPFARIGKLSIDPKLCSPRMCLVTAAVMIIPPVVLPPLCHWDVEQRERPAFVQHFRRLRIRQLAVAD
jgi:hypothetical protein